MASSYHRGVAAADELPDLVKDALTVDTFVYGAPLYDDSDSQQDLLADVLLEAGGNEYSQGRVQSKPSTGTTQRNQTDGYHWDGEEQEQQGGAAFCIHSCSLLSLAPLGVGKMTELQFSLRRLITGKQAGTHPVCLLSRATTASEHLQFYILSSYISDSNLAAA